MVLEKHEGGHSAVEIREKLQALLNKYGLNHCSATIADATEDLDVDEGFHQDSEDAEAGIEVGQDSSELQQPDILPDSVLPLVFTTDNAPAIVAAMNTEDWFRVPCMAHVTALAVNAANKIPSIKKWK